MKFISILRGINVSGQKKIKMADLKALYEGLGLCNVSTYIQMVMAKANCRMYLLKKSYL
jgi:uncharacterized protein (DUF1697 family)